MASTTKANLSHEDAQAMSGREAPFMVFTGIARHVSDRRAVTIAAARLET
jgi:hypothetical protein